MFHLCFRNWWTNAISECYKYCSPDLLFAVENCYCISLTTLNNLPVIRSTAIVLLIHQNWSSSRHASLHSIYGHDLQSSVLRNSIPRKKFCKQLLEMYLMQGIVLVASTCLGNKIPENTSPFFVREVTLIQQCWRFQIHKSTERKYNKGMTTRLYLKEFVICKMFFTVLSAASQLCLTASNILWTKPCQVYLKKKQSGSLYHGWQSSRILNF